MVASPRHCSACGGRLPEGDRWPRTCAACGVTCFANPRCVVCVLQPVGNELMTLRSFDGDDALFLPQQVFYPDASWQDVGSRAMLDAQIRVAPSELEHVLTRSEEGVLLIVARAPKLPFGDLPTFLPTADDAERVFVGEAQRMRTTTETDVVRSFFMA